MPIAKAVNFAIAPDGEQVPVDIFYTLDGPENGETVVLLSGLGAQLVHNSYNTFVVPLVSKGYRVLRLDNRDSGLSSKLDELGCQGMVFDKLRNRFSAQNPANQLNSPFDKKAPIHSMLHILPENLQDCDYTQFIQPGARPHEFMIASSDVDFSAKAPFPVSEKKGFWNSIGFGRKDPGYTLYDMAMDVILLCNHLGIDRFHVGGVSMGGMITQCVAALIPSRILSITLIMTSTGNDNHNAALKFLLSTFVTRKAPAPDGPIEEAVKFALDTQMLIGMPDKDRTYNNGHKSEDYVFSFASRPKRNEFALRRQMDAIDSQESRDKVLDYLASRIPILVFHGKQDQLVPFSNGPHIASILHSSLDRQLNPPKFIKKEDLANRGEEPAKKELEILQQNFSADDDRLDVTTTIAGEYNGRKIFSTTAFLDQAAHDLPDDFCKYLVPTMMSHFDASMNRVDVLLPRNFPTPNWGTEKDLCFGALAELIALDLVEPVADESIAVVEGTVEVQGNDSATEDSSPIAAQEASSGQAKIDITRAEESTTENNAIEAKTENVSA